MADVVAWCFHSPRRLLAVLVVAVAVLIGIGMAVRSLGPHTAAAPSRAPSSTASMADSRAPVNAAVAFTRRWASKPDSATAEQWRQGLEGLVTPELGRLLADTDPAGLPGGEPAGDPTVRFLSAASAMIEVPLSTGRRVLVTVVLFNGRWLAYDVRPVAGDVGAASGAAPGVAAPGSSG